MSDNRSVLSELEDKLLFGLASATGSLLENDELIATLEETKTKSTAITEAIEKGKITEKIIEEAR
jgi:dynein heavy chain